MLFDKITLLSDGNTLYDGSPKEVFSFYNKLDLTIEKYVNPSDELLKLANNP
jgi:ABC-type multidrug transport system ATPase subunit